MGLQDVIKSRPMQLHEAAALRRAALTGVAAFRFRALALTCDVMHQLQGSQMLKLCRREHHDLSIRLAQSCPAYFKEDDKVFHEASGLLQHGIAATAASFGQADLLV